MALKDLIVHGPVPPMAKPSTKRRGRPPKKRPPPTKTYKTRTHRHDAQTINNHTWFYEDRAGLLVVHEIWDRDNFVRTDQFTIPWLMVAASWKRHELKPPLISNGEQ